MIVVPSPYDRIGQGINRNVVVKALSDGTVQSIEISKVEFYVSIFHMTYVLAGDVNVRNKANNCDVTVEDVGRAKPTGDPICEQLWSAINLSNDLNISTARSDRGRLRKDEELTSDNSRSCGLDWESINKRLVFGTGILWHEAGQCFTNFQDTAWKIHCGGIRHGEVNG